MRYTKGVLAQRRLAADPISTDDFDRANSTTVGTDDQGNTWTEVVGNWAIVSNRLKCSTPTANTYNYITLALGEADVDIELGIPFRSPSVAQNAGILFRYTDTNNWWRFVYARNGDSSESLYIQKRVSGTVSNAATPVSASATAKVRVVANGTSIDCYGDDVLEFSLTGQTDHQSVTTHGCVIQDTGGSGGDDWQLDDWSVYIAGQRP